MFLDSVYHNKLDLIVFTDTVSQKYLNNHDLIVINEPIEIIVRDRFKYFYKYLLKQNLNEYFSILDSKDVLVQKNPLDYFQDINLDCIFCHEGGLHYQSEWNYLDQLNFQKGFNKFKQDIKNWKIINAGVLSGKSYKLAEICFYIWSLTIKNNSGGTDQATLNYMVNNFYCSNILGPESLYCLTGEGVKRNWYNDYKLENNIYFNTKLNNSYFFVHQWERIIQ